MLEDTSNAGSSATSRKGDQVDLVSKFLAPLCARDEAARNVALAAARTTVEGWLGEVSSPKSNPNNNCEIGPELEEKEREKQLFLLAPNSLNGNLGTCRAQLRDGFPGDGFFTRSASEGAAKIFARKPSFDANIITFDCVDGKNNEPGTNESNSTPSYRLRETESRFSSSSESEKRLFASCEGLNEEEKQRGRHQIRIKGGRQKLFEEDDELDADTRVYGKSPKFDDDFGNFELRSRRFRESSEDLYGTSLEAEKVVFNTLDGFLNEDSPGAAATVPPDRNPIPVQAKRPASRNEDVPWKNSSLLESPVDVVTPGDVGRMLNLGNALDGPRQTQANKYLSLVSLHLPVILRLSVNCPFQNVRIKCTEIIQMIKDRGLPVPEPAFDGPSAFVPVSEVASLISALSPGGDTRGEEGQGEGEGEGPG